MIIFRAIIISILICGISHSTAIFLVRTPNEIVVAADSRVVSAELGETERIEFAQICKIRKFAHVFTVSNGLSTIPRGGFYVQSILDSASNTPGSLIDKISAFENMVKISLKKVLGNMRTNQTTDMLSKDFLQNHIGVNFFGIEKNIPILFFRRIEFNFSISDSIFINIEPKDCPGPDCSTGIAYFNTGPTELKMRFLKEYPNFWEGDLIDAAKKFIQMQMSIDSVGIGPPIDILRITKEEANWIQKKAECE